MPNSLFQKFVFPPVRDIFDLDEVKIVHAFDDYKIYIQPEIRIEQSTEDYFQLIERRSSRGKSRNDARNNANDIIYSWQQNDSLLLLDNYFTLPLDEKWRHQELELILKVPVGMRIHLDKSLDEIAWNSNYYNDYWPGDLVGKEWRMTNSGLSKHRTK